MAVEDVKKCNGQHPKDNGEFVACIASKETALDKCSAQEIKNKYMAETPERLSPEEFLLSAFDFFKTDRLDLGSLVRCAMAGTCPSAEIAEGVLARMTEAGILSWERDEKGIVWLSRAKPKETGF